MEISPSHPESGKGTVYFVGAGPGDPDLLTVRGARLLASADAVVYDALVNPILLDQAPPEAERFDVGRRKGEKHMQLEQVTHILEELAETHEVVVRLKGGDPFIFGRGGEEAMSLRAAGVPFEVVPGVTAGVAVPAYAGIPLTHRGLASSVTFITGHLVSGASEEGGVRPFQAPNEGTLVIFMGLGRILDIADELMRQGRPPETPTAVVDSGTLPDQRTVVGTLGNIAQKTVDAGISGPALIVVGEVVGLREKILWYSEVQGAEPAAGSDGEAEVRVVLLDV